MIREELLQVAKPILFNTEMVRAVLDGRKTVTRRLCKLPGADYIETDTDGNVIGIYNQYEGKVLDKMAYAPYQPGGILYVREIWCAYHMPDGSVIYKYKASDPNGNRRPTGQEYDDSWEIRQWRPSIYMPKEAARIFLKVTDARVERLQDITDEQAKEEGSNWRNGKNVGFEEKMRRSAAERFAEIWNSTIKKSDLERYGWEANPWVWVIEFERVVEE